MFRKISGASAITFGRFAGTAEVADQVFAFLQLLILQLQDGTDTFQREIDPLMKIKDNYPKMILARTHQEAYQHEGIQIVDVADWLIMY